MSDLAPAYLQVLRCPETLQRLSVAPGEVLARLGKGGLAERVKAALVREDGRVAYPIKDGIPMLLIEEAIQITPAAE